MRDGEFTARIGTIALPCMLRLFYSGITSLWGGLSASILRQSTYSTARFGLYNIVAERAKQWSGQDKLSMPWTIACAGLAGGMAGMIGNPAEVRPVSDMVIP